MCFLQIVSRWDFEAHHFLGSGGQLEARFALSTDDVCGDSLSQASVRSMRWWRKHFGLSREQLWDLSRGAVGCDFWW